MKKEALTELVNTKYPHLHRLEVEAWIGRAWNSLLYESFKMDPANVDFFCKNYHGVAVEKDTYDQYFSSLPVRPVQLPDNADGVRRVMYEKDGISISFVPIQRDSFGVFDELDVNLISDSIGYSTKFDKILWERDPGIPTVQMDIVPMYEDYDDDDEVSAPMGFDVRLLFMVDQLMNGVPEEKFWQKMAHDKVNN